MKIVRRYYTWTNNHVHSKIDRTLVNSEWLTKWPHLEVVAMDPYFSNHSLLCITVEVQQDRSPRPFKFLNHLADHLDFQKVVENVWYTAIQGTPMESIWLKLKAIKVKINKLNEKGFSKVNLRVKTIRQHLIELQE